MRRGSSMHERGSCGGWTAVASCVAVSCVAASSLAAAAPARSADIPAASGDSFPEPFAASGMGRQPELRPKA